MYLRHSPLEWSMNLDYGNITYSRVLPKCLQENKMYVSPATLTELLLNIIWK